jgi:maleylacetate reductase
VIVRWGLGELGGVLAELGVERALLVTSERFAGLELPVDARFTGVRPHSPVDAVSAATAAAKGSDGVVGLGGGSAIDTAKAVAAASELTLVAVPTTYSGAEWTPYFGMRDEARGVKTGGSGPGTAGIVYEPLLTLELPRAETVGTALNALAHCAEALYAGPCDDAAEGARLIDRHIPEVVASPGDVAARSGLLAGAMHAGRALAERGLFLGHALAQALGGRYGLAHGAMNALCLPPALRFNAVAVPDAIASLGTAFGTADPIARCEDLARLGGFERLRDFGVSEDDLRDLAEQAAARPGARANPRPVTPEDAEQLLRSIW